MCDNKLGIYLFARDLICRAEANGKVATKVFNLYVSICFIFISL